MYTMTRFLFFGGVNKPILYLLLRSMCSTVPIRDFDIGNSVRRNGPYIALNKNERREIKLFFIVDAPIMNILIIRGIIYHGHQKIVNLNLSK